MRSYNAERTEPSRLASLLTTLRTPDWTDRDLADILAHQLRAPLVSDLQTLASATGDGLDDVARDAHPPIGTFADLFHHPSPPLELLKLTKQFAKISDKGANAAVPGEVASVIYYAAIVAALLRLGQRITELNDPALRKGLLWILEQSWLDEPMREFFQQGLGSLPDPAAPIA